MATDTFSEETQERYRDSPLWKPWMSRIRLRQITQMDELDEFLEIAESHPYISWDIETETLYPDPATLVGHCLAYSEDEAIYVPTRHQIGPNLDHETVHKKVMGILEKKCVVLFNYMFEGKYLQLAGWDRKADLDHLRDVFLYNKLYNSNSKLGGEGLKDAVRERWPDLEMLEIKEVPGVLVKAKKGKKQQLNFGFSDPADATLYAAADPVMTLRLFKALQEPVEKFQMTICQMEHRLLRTLLKMSVTPVSIDRAILKQGEDVLLRMLAEIRDEIHRDAGYSLDLNSSAAVAQYLLSKGVPLPKTDKGNYSSTASVIEELSTQYPIAAKITRYRAIAKELSTYVLPLYTQTSDDAPYTYFKFNSIKADTGRMSSGGVSPGEHYCRMNVQSIPSASSYQKSPCHKILNPDFVPRPETLNLGIVETPEVLDEQP